TRDLCQLLRRNRYSTRHVDVGHYLGAHCNIQISSRELDSFVGCLDQNICQHRECGLRWDTRSDSCKTLLELFARDREAHPFPLVEFELRPSTSLLRELKASSCSRSCGALVNRSNL